jgi:hypothetical protein
MNHNRISVKRVIKYIQQGYPYETARILAKYDSLEGRRHV